MITVLGWFATLLVLAGFYVNSLKKSSLAMIMWIIGDGLWILYDYLISNWSHAILSTIIIGLNIYGIYNYKKGNKING